MQQVLLQWIQAASKLQKKHLARDSETTTGYINQIANGHSTPSVELTTRIVAAANTIRRNDPDGYLPEVRRGDLNKTCRGCHFYIKCGGKE
ncbi:MAG: hypothetical protein V3U75_13445 [Methylococcaceae bacterium]